MAKTYRVGISSLVHDHVWGELHHWKAMPNVKLVAVGDSHPHLVARAHQEFSVERTYGNWQEMLAKEELDIVQAASENSTAADIVEAAAAKGIHVISEKPMSARLSQANRMVKAAQKAGTQLMINWPTAWSPAIQELERRLLRNEIGPVFYFKFRSAHNGPKEIGCTPEFWGWLYDEEKNGAGALMDYCCYSADMCARFFGLPQAVNGFRGVFLKDYPVPDDNAMIVMKYAHAFGVAEASWTQKVHYASPNPIAYCAEGSIAVSGNQLLIQRPNRETETIEAPATVAPYRSGPEYFIHCLENGLPVEGFCSAAVSRDAQEILEAGLRSADSGKTMVLPLSEG